MTTKPILQTGCAEEEPPASPTKRELFELLLQSGGATQCVSIEWIESFANAVLARWGSPTPQPPADGEVAELVETLKGIAYWRRHGKPGGPAPTSLDIRQADRLDRAAELLLQRQAPVPVSERLPEPSECAPWPKDSDASAWCWMGQKVDGGWEWEQRSAGYLVAFPGDFTHWLPAHALPLPEVGE